MQKHINQIINGSRYSWYGLRDTFKTERAFQIEVVAAVIAIPLGWHLGQGAVQQALLIGSVLLVLAVELLNTGIEAVVNLISPNPHPLAKKAKDAGSAAVMVSIVIAVVVWFALLVN